MSKRYIDADKLIDDMAEYAIECIKTVNEQPTADVRENVRGEWRRIINGVQCQKCGHVQDDTTDFCPFCGADMRSHNYQGEKS